MVLLKLSCFKTYPMSINQLYPCLVLLLVYFPMPSASVTWNPDIPFQKVKAVEGSSAIFAWNITFDKTNTGIFRVDIERVNDAGTVLESIIYRLTSDANATVPNSSYKHREMDLQILYHTPSNTAKIIFTLDNVNFTVDNRQKFKATGLFSPKFVNQFRSADLEVRGFPESTHIELYPNNTQFCRGDQIQVNCSASEKPQANYSLYQNDQMISSSSTGYFNQVELNMSGSIAITCVPSNEAGYSPSSRSLEVKESPKIDNCQISENGKKATYAVEGRKVELKCDISGSGPLNTTWTNGQQVWDNSTLVFQPIKRSDTGTYKLTVRNGEECNETETSLKLAVYYVPEATTMRILPINKTQFCLGDQIRVNCLSARANPTRVNYSLYQNDKLIKTMTGAVGQPKVNVIHRIVRSIRIRFRIITVVVIPDFNNFHVNVSGNVSLTCVPSNEAGNGENSTLRLAVEEPPSIANCAKIINDTYLAYGAVRETDNVKLMCNISGSKPLEVSWRYGHKVWYQEALVFQSINRRDAGTYEIRVRSGGVCNQTATQNMTLEVFFIKINYRIQENLTLAAVLGALLALSIILNIVLIVAFFWFRRKDSKKKSGKRLNDKADERGGTNNRKNDITLHETSFTNTATTTPNVQEYEPIRRRGLATSNTGIPEYEAVTTRTQQAQPQSGVQTSHPRPQYDSADRQGQTGVVLNPPPVTYQTIQPRTGDYGSLSPLTRLSR